MFLNLGKPASLAVIPALLAFATVAAEGQAAPPGTARIVGDVVPGAEWTQTTPESVGYSSAKLEALRGWVKTQDTSSMMVMVQGRVIFSYGDVSQTSKVASVRKSVLGMLYGKYVADDTIDLDKTVKQLGLDDTDPFLPMEANATLVQLLASRSGIYLPVLKTPPETLPGWDQGKYMPPRGSEYPGTHYVYNNWDFNAAGTAFEKVTHKDMFQAIQTDLAVPIGMQDYDLSKQKKVPAPAPLVDLSKNLASVCRAEVSSDFDVERLLPSLQEPTAKPVKP
jgi:CubicO group peptidase (beta-lactamase class C family)